MQLKIPAVAKLQLRLVTFEPLFKEVVERPELALVEQRACDLADVSLLVLQVALAVRPPSVDVVA